MKEREKTESEVEREMERESERETDRVMGHTLKERDRWKESGCVTYTNRVRQTNRQIQRHTDRQ